MDIPHALDPPYTAMPAALGQVIEPEPPPLIADQELPLYPHNTKFEPPPVEQSVEEAPSVTVTVAPLPKEVQSDSFPTVVIGGTPKPMAPEPEPPRVWALADTTSISSSEPKMYTFMALVFS
jgi:hypothetical protein